MPAARTILDRIQAAAAAGRALPPEDGAALAQAITVAKRDGISIDAALGLAPGWQRAARIRERDEAIRALAGAFSGRPGARSLRAALRRYRSRAYEADRENGVPDGEHRHLFVLLEVNGGEAISEAHLRKLLE